MERVEQKDQKVGKYQDGSEPAAKAFGTSRCAPSHLPDLPDLFVGLLVALRAAPLEFRGIEASTMDCDLGDVALAYTGRRFGLHVAPCRRAGMRTSHVRALARAVVLNGRT
jgi:hypothetical protein